MLDIDIIIIHMFRYEALKICLKSLNDQEERPTRIIIMDCQGDVKLLEDIAKNNLLDLDWLIVHTPHHYHNTLAPNLARKYINKPIMAIIDSDCIFPPTILKETKKILKENSSNIFIGAKRYEGQKTGGYTAPPPPEKHLCGSFLVLHTSTFDELGGFNPFMLTSGGYMDSDFIIRLERKGYIRKVIDQEYYHPYHGGYSANMNDLQKNKEVSVNSIFNKDTKEWKYGNQYWRFDRPTLHPYS